jgi:hypothetical protein
MSTSEDRAAQWHRLFNRLDAAVTHHRRGKSEPFAFMDEVDEDLYAARDRIYRDVTPNTSNSLEFLDKIEEYDRIAKVISESCPHMHYIRLSECVKALLQNHQSASN